MLVYPWFSLESKNSNKVKALSWESGLDWGHEGQKWHKLAVIWRCVVTDCQDGGKIVCRSCSVACHCGNLSKWRKKPAMRWSLEMGIGGESDKILFDFIFWVREEFGIADRCSQLKIARFRVTISVKDFQVTANCPKGRVFEIDSQEQWNAAIIKVITKERESIGRLPKSGLYLNIINARRSLLICVHSLTM